MFFKRTTWYDLRYSRSSFHTLFSSVFRPFQCRTIFKKLRTTTQNNQKIMNIGRTIIIEMHPQPRAAKRLRLGGVKPLQLTTFTTFSAVFQKTQSSQSNAETKAEIEASGTQNHQKTEKRAPRKTVKNKTTKSWSEFEFRYRKGTRDPRLFGVIFEP